MVGERGNAKRSQKSKSRPSSQEGRQREIWELQADFLAQQPVQALHRHSTQTHQRGHWPQNSKNAILHYQIIKKLKNYYLLEIILETGRSHQIRAQLSNINCPIKGDVKYGFRRPNKDKSINLHARSILFTHPVSKKTIKIICPLPKENIWSECK